MIKSWKNGEYEVLADTEEVFEDDPAKGIPAIVFDKSGNESTLWCAIEEGELDGKKIPLNIRKWLEDIRPSVETYLYP